MAKSSVLAHPLAEHTATPAGDLLDLLERPGWHFQAACREAPPGVTWFADQGRSVQDAREICTGCRVLHECRSWALDQPNLHGLWGGLTAQERARQRRQALPAA